MTALQKRHDFFVQRGCRISDYGVDRLYATEYTEREIKLIFSKARGNNALSREEVEKFRSAVLFECIAMDYRSDWSVQVLV